MVDSLGDDGDSAVYGYLAAMPGWKREVGKRLDSLIRRNVLKLRKAVRSNSLLYGIDGEGWILSVHPFTKYLKVTFFRGTSLQPVPPGPGVGKEARSVDIHEGKLDEEQMADWVRQAAALPAWVP